MIKKQYRAEIDGLRAFAVIPVIFYHFNITYFNGGFLGVDIFFVISGYLITSLILYEIDHNTFSLINFLERRIRRIIPALYSVIILSSITSWFLLSSGMIWDFWQSVTASILFLSNFLFAIENDYFAISSKYKPLIHTWSLSIEEQFYLFFPIMFLLFYKKSKIIFHLVLIIISLFSLVIFIKNFQLPYDPDNKIFSRINEVGFGSFFITFGRIWELLFGSLISMFLIKKKQYRSNLLSIFSFSIILYCFLFYNEDFVSREYYSLVIVLSTSTLIIFTSKDTWLGNILSNKLIVFIGLISYSLYLTHQPVITFVTIYFNNLNTLSIFISTIIIFILSVTIYYLIEKPFRNRSKISSKFILIIFFISTLLILLISIIALKDKFINLQYNYTISNIDKKFSSLVLNMKNESNKTIKKIKKIKNNISNEINNNSIIFIGDSQSWDWIRSLYTTDLKNNYNFIAFETDFSCYKYLDKFKLLKNNNCSLFIKELSTLKKYKKDIPIIINHDYTSLRDIKNIEYLISYLHNDFNKILLVGNAKFVDVTLLSLSLARDLSKNKIININNSLKNIENKKTLFLNKKLKKLSNLYNLNFISEYDLFCSLDVCEVFSKSFIPYIYDDMHFTNEGEIVIGEKIYIYLTNNNGLLE